MSKQRNSRIMASLPRMARPVLPSRYAEKNRKLTSEVSTMQGSFKYSITPYLKEVVNSLDGADPASIIAVMKGSQIGFTEGVLVNGICWIIANDPGNVLSLSATDEMSKEMVEQRLDQAIKSMNISHLIKPSIIRKKNQRTGDTSKSKEFPGGRAIFAGIGNVNKFSRQRSMKYAFLDDWDAAPVIDKEQGSLFELLQQRFSTAAKQMKQMYISTPVLRPSNIEAVYLKGDQRKWMLPCPKCGERIELKWRYQNEKGDDRGVFWEVDENRELIEDSVGYICQKCGRLFDESHKYDMNLSGIWVPTAKPQRPNYRSYHISCLYNAPHMYNWTDYIYKWLDIYKDGSESASKKKVFFNQVLGIPWEQKQKNIKGGQLSKNTRTYEVGTIPSEMCEADGNGEIVMITCSADLNGTLDDARLDYDVWAHAENGSIYSIDHGSIGTYKTNRKKDHSERTKFTYRNEKENNVWDTFYNQVIFRDYPTDASGVMRITVTGIDTGFHTRFAYTFIDQHTGIYGIKGRVNDKGIRAGMDVKTFKKSKERNGLYVIETDILKDDLAEMINLQWSQKQDREQPPGFMNFPSPGDNKYSVPGYFAQYEAEEKRIDENEDGEVIGWKWQKKYQTAQNHFFDTAVYNLALREIFSQEFCYEIEKIRNAKYADYVRIVKNMIKNQQ